MAFKIKKRTQIPTFFSFLNNFHFGYYITGNANTVLGNAVLTNDVNYLLQKLFINFNHVYKHFN